MAMYQEEPYPETTKGGPAEDLMMGTDYTEKHIIVSQPQKDVSHGVIAFYPEPSLPVSLFQ